MTVLIAGRVMAKRVQGKIAFLELRESGCDIQLFCRINALGEEAFAALCDLDVGDWIAVHGTMMRTPPRAAVRGGGFLRADEQVAAASAREVPRPDGQGDPLPPALCRPRHEPRGAHHLRAPLQDRLGHPPLHGGPGLLRGGDAVSACHHRRREREALHHALQRARSRLLPAHRHGAAAEASARGRFREGVRDRPPVPQRGHGSVPQPRVHHHGGLSRPSATSTP